jgi:uncharacterized membrane protein YjdF
MDPKKAASLDARSRALLVRFPRLVKAHDWNGLAGAMDEKTVLILMKSRRIIRGRSAIIDFWKTIVAQGLIGFNITFKKDALDPVDFLVSECLGEGPYTYYDMVKHCIGNYRIIFRKKLDAEGACYILVRHQSVCVNLVGLMAFCNL